jgi:23S rRNA pseudouridine2605 synthase
VAVDGAVVTEPGAKANPEKSSITVDGKPINPRPEKVYVLLNKPRGYMSTRRDPHAKRVVTDLVKNLDMSLHPVGRLDVDTEGLLILTNDGDFTFKMTHPSHEMPKTYRAEVKGLAAQQTLNRLACGIPLEDGMTAPAKVRLAALNTARMTSVVDITIIEGRKRQVRRMFEAVGHPVIRLTRTKIGSIILDKLKSGEWRFLTPQEVDDLLAAASEH